MLLEGHLPAEFSSNILAWKFLVILQTLISSGVFEDGANICTKVALRE